jgi:hypothetical protein
MNKVKIQDLEEYFLVFKSNFEQFCDTPIKGRYGIYDNVGAFIQVSKRKDDEEVFGLSELDGNWVITELVGNLHEDGTNMYKQDFFIIQRNAEKSYWTEEKAIEQAEYNVNLFAEPA